MPLKTMGCGCRCGGPFDVYGEHGELPALNDLFYRDCTVTTTALETIGDASGDGRYNSIDAGWYVDYDPDGTDDSAKINNTIAVMSLPQDDEGEGEFITLAEELCWAVRDSNEDHPDGDVDVELLDSPDDLDDDAEWIAGADADYDDDTSELRVTTAASTSAATLTQTTDATLVDATYRANVLAKKTDVRWLRMRVTTPGATTATAYIDLQSLLISDPANSNIPSNLHVHEAGDGYHLYVYEFAVSGASGASTFELRLVDGDLATSIDATTAGDGSIILSASLRKVTTGTGFDVSLIDCRNKEVERFRYPLKTVYVDGDIPTPLRDYGFVGGNSEHDVVGASTSPDRQAARPLAVYQFDTNFVIDQIPGPENAQLARRWANEDGVGFLSTAGDVDLVDIDHLFIVGAEAAGDKRLWGSRGGAFYAWYPVQYNWQGGGGEAYEPLLDPVSPQPIVAASPHGFPKVWSIKPPRSYRAESPGPPASPGSASIWYYVASSVTSSWSIHRGTYERDYYTLQSDDGAIDDLSVPLIYGTGSAWWTSATSTNDRFYTVGLATEGPTYGLVHFESRPPSTAWGAMLEADDDGTLAIAIFTDCSCAVTLDTDKIDDWNTYNSTGSGSPPTGAIETYALSRRIVVAIGASTGSEIETETIWRDTEAGLAETGNQRRFFGCMVVQESERGVAIDPVRAMYVECIYSSAPSSGSAGVVSHYRLNAVNSSGAVQWTLDSLPLSVADSSPDPWQSSDRFIYVRGFAMCDARMKDEISPGLHIGRDWAISHDGTITWPARTVVDTLGEDQHRPLPTIILDSIKNSSLLPLTPARNQWPTARGTSAPWIVEPGADAVTSWTVGADATFASNKLAADANLTNSIACELVENQQGSGWVASGLFRYRITIDAEPDEKRYLLWHWEGFHGATDATAWIDLTDKHFEGSGVGLSATSVEDLGGGRARYNIEVVNTDGDFTGDAMLIRIVDNAGLTDLDATTGEGVTIHSVRLSRRCEVDPKDVT